VAPEEAMENLNTVLAHAWMVRTFLKHADEIQEDEELMETPRMIFDFTRALEPSYQRKDAKEYLRRAAGKLPKLRKVAQVFAREYRRVSDHTNFQMAALSLNACVARIEQILAEVKHVPEDGPADSAGNRQAPPVEAGMEHGLEGDALGREA
jgi:hypothetical protein